MTDEYQPDAIDPAKFRLFGEWLSYECGGCTCAGTAPGYPQHEPGCGWEPVTALGDILAAERELASLRAQRDAALELCAEDEADPFTPITALNRAIRAALGVQPEGS